MEDEELGLYDSNFDLYNIAQNPVNPIHRRTKTGSTEVARNTTYSDSIYDEGFLPNVSLNWDDSGLSTSEFIDEARAQKQPWITKAGAGIARVGTKALTEIAKMPGVLGGIAAGTAGQIQDLVSGEDTTDFMQTAFNNSWVNGLNDINEQINTEILPVYVKKAVEEGNLWDNISSMDFWATEGADGIGYIVSMLAPGSLIAKGNLGAKMLGIGKFAKMGNKVDDAVNVLGKLKLSPKNADLATATIANTLFEAGAEAQGAMETFKVELDQKLADDEITQDDYDTQIKRQSEVGRNVFLANAAILIGPNAIMAKMLWGKPRNKGLNLKRSKDSAAKVYAEIEKPTLTKSIKEGAEDLITGTAREGFWEEGMQSTAEQHFTEQGFEKSEGFISDFFGSIGDLPKAYANMISETDGQKAIFLGAAFGGGMQVVQNRSERLKERTATNNLVKYANKSLNDFYNVFKGDNVKEDPDSSDEAAFIAKLRGFQNMESMSEIYDFAVSTGNTAMIESLRNIATTNLVKPFIANESLGLGALKEHLESSKELIDLSDSAWEGSTDSFIEYVMETAKEMESSYNTYNDFAPTVVQVEHKDATEKDKLSFYNMLADKYVNAKSTQSHLQKEVVKQNKAMDALLEERGKTRADLETNTLFAKEFNQDIRVQRLKESIKTNTNLLKNATKEVDNLWKGDAIQKEFNTQINDKVKLEKEKTNTKIVDEALQKIKTAKTIKEVESITVPEGVSKEAVKDAKKNRIEAIKVEDNLKNTEVRKNNETFDQNKKTAEQVAIDTLEYVKNNYNEGEIITVEEGFGLDKALTDKDATIKTITEENVTLDVEGTEVTISTTSLQKVHHSNNANLSTEGGSTEVTQNTTTDSKSGTVYEKRGDSRILSSDNKGGVLFDNQAALDFEQSPRDKVGEEKGIELGVEGFSDNQKKALTMFKSKDFSDIGFLIDHLPLSIQLSEGVTAPLATKSEKSDKYNKIFDETTRHLRETIIKEIVNNGVVLENIKVPIAGQWNGELQIAPKQDGKVVENPIAGLYEFSGKTEKIKSTDFYMVDDFGLLSNIDGKTFPVNRNLVNSKGEMYLLVNMANGKKFPLKLNVKKISQEKSEGLYELYNHIFDNVKLGKTKRIADIEDKELVETIKTTFKDELELFATNKKSFDRVTIGNLLDLMIWDKTGNPKTKLQFYDNKLALGSETFNKESFSTAEGKSNFVDFMTDVKRQQIRFKPRKTDSDRAFNFNNRSYVDYLLGGDILNTNAVIGKPTFAGRTSVYLDTKGVKVNGVDSKFNKDVPTYLSKTLLGTTTQLKTQLPGLHSNPVALNEEGSHYVSTKDKKIKYSRVSTLKDSKIDMTALNIYNAAKRGDVVDELIRQFFSNPYMTKNEFVQHGATQVVDINKKKPNSEVIITVNFFEELFNILEVYKTEFDSKNYTVYANSPSMAGKIGKELFAGTGDLLAYNNTTKQWVFIDIKTSSQSRGEAYAGKDTYGYKKKDAIQQNAYRELFRQLNKKNGTQISKLLILPLTVKSEDPGVNSRYNNISIGTTVKDGKFLNVSMEKDVYELTDKKPTSTKSTKVDVNEFDTTADTLQDNLGDGEVSASFNDMLAALEEQGVTVKKPVGKPTESSTKKVSKKVPTKTLTEEQQLEFITQYEAAIEVYNHNYKGKDYIILPKSFYVVDKSTNRLITNVPLILNIISGYNATIPTAFRIDKNIVKNIWNSRLNVVSLPKEPTTKTTKKVAPVKKVDTMDFSKLTTAQAESIIGELMEKLPARIMEINKVLENGKSIQEQVKELYSKLENVDIAKNIIQTKCKS